MAEENNPFGINTTKRYVSEGAERELYTPHFIRDHAKVELVDYMGGDGMVERIATAGHTLNIFPEKPNREEFLGHLVASGIEAPFKSIQLKFNFKVPIESALTLVYEPTASVNEYSGRYSQMLDSAYIHEMPWANTKKAREILLKIREKAVSNYQAMLKMDFARELARAGLGINNDTAFFWKNDLVSTTNFIRRQRRLSPSILTRDIIEQIDETAEKVAPESWSALTCRNSVRKIYLTHPNDDEIVDGPLSPPQWATSSTRRTVVPSLEEELFSPKTFLDHGEFQVVDYMGDDNSFAEAARISYGSGTKRLQDNINLTRSLIRDLHTSPIEMAELAVENKVPLFVDPRQAGRHRTLDQHGFMGYNPLGSQFYLPPKVEMKYQDKINRQGRGKDMEPEEKEMVEKYLLDTFEAERAAAIELRDLKVAEHVVRSIKGVGFYTKQWRTGDMHNWGHFLMLRLDKHAQKEIRDLASLVDSAAKAFVPSANEALFNYIINGMKLSAKEIELINKMAVNNQFNSKTDLDNLSLYQGAGFLISKKDKEGNVIYDTQKNPIKELGREGQAFKSKLQRLLKELK